MSHLMKAARITFDIFIFIAICYTGKAMRRRFMSFKSGFFCGDESLKYPYHKQTVGSTPLFVTGLALPTLVIIAGELFKRVPNSKTATAATTGNKINNYRLGYRLGKCCTQTGIYIFGFVLTVLAAEIVKVGSGRLRPHFFDVCQPQLPDGSNCNDPWNFGRYIEEYNCSAQNSTKKMLAEVTKSFPSGHASISFYSMLYTSICLQASLSTRTSKLLKHLLQFICMLLAWYVSLTRVFDNMHHWSDIAAGILLGSIAASCLALFVANDNEITRQVTRRRHHKQSQRNRKRRRERNYAAAIRDEMYV